MGVGGRSPDLRLEFLLKSTGDPLAEDGPNVIEGLRASPKRISSVYVYDRRGTELFEQQCKTPEYYLRRAETTLLRRHAAEILACSGYVPIVELGAGTAEKTRTLLAEYANGGHRCDYFPIDVDWRTLRAAMATLVPDFPQLFVHGIGATYQKGLRALRKCPERRLFLFLGSSLGNMELHEIDDLLTDLFYTGSEGDFLLLGADLDKDAAVINRAYNDSAGLGSRSTLNMLSHLNRRYAGNFHLHDFRCRSHYCAPERKNVVRIESRVDQTVVLAKLNMTVSFDRAELIDAEVMWKFDPDELGAILRRAGFCTIHRWIEPVFRYGLFLARRGRCL